MEDLIAESRTQVSKPLLPGEQRGCLVPQAFIMRWSLQDLRGFSSQIRRMVRDWVTKTKLHKTPSQCAYSLTLRVQDPLGADLCIPGQCEEGSKCANQTQSWTTQNNLPLLQVNMSLVFNHLKAIKKWVTKVNFHIKIFWTLVLQQVVLCE